MHSSHYTELCYIYTDNAEHLHLYSNIIYCFKMFSFSWLFSNKMKLLASSERHNEGQLTLHLYGFTCRFYWWNWVIFNEERWICETRQLPRQRAELLWWRADDGGQAWIGWHIRQLKGATTGGGRRWGARSQMRMMGRRQRWGSHKSVEFYILWILVLFLLLLLFLRHLVA